MTDRKQGASQSLEDAIDQAAEREGEAIRKAHRSAFARHGHREVFTRPGRNGAAADEQTK